MKKITQADKPKSVFLTPGDKFTTSWTGKSVFQVAPTRDGAEPQCDLCALNFKKGNDPIARACSRFACISSIRPDKKNVIVRLISIK